MLKDFKTNKSLSHFFLKMLLAFAILLNFIIKSIFFYASVVLLKNILVMQVLILTCTFSEM
jgi:hypothetical protein